MNPNDNNLNVNNNLQPNTNSGDNSTAIPPVTPEPVLPNATQDAVSSIAPKEEIPMSIEKVEEPAQVTSIFSQDLNVISNQPVGKPQTESEKDQGALYNFQTNAINPNEVSPSASVDINDFRIDETEKVSPLPEISNLESSVETKSINEPITNLSGTTETVKPTEPITSEPIVVPAPTGSNTLIIAVLGVIFAAGLIAGAYFVFFRKPTSTETPTAVTSEYKTEKIVVKANTEIKVLSEEEYVTTVKSYIERYNNNIRNFKVKQATPNLTLEQKLEIYMSYSTEVLNIYTELQNLRVPQSFRDSHDKLTLSLYALNSLFDTLVIDAKNKTLTVASEKQILESIIKAETVAASAFNEIANSKQ